MRHALSSAKSPVTTAAPIIASRGRFPVTACAALATFLLQTHLALADVALSHRSLSGDPYGNDGDPAQEEPDRIFAVFGHLGIGTPVGYAGIALDYVPAPWLVIETGVGVAKGVQLSLGTRFLLSRGRVTAIGLGLGASVGNSDQYVLNFEEHTRYAFRPGYFANLDLGLEHR